MGLDIARGLALVGMLFAHTVPEGDAETVFDGRSSILFATIAGVSLGLMSGGASRVGREDRGRVARVVALRGVVLVVLGLALTAFDTPVAIILDTYGLLFVVAIPLLFAPRWAIAAIAAVSALLGPVAVDAVDAAVEAATGPAESVVESAWAYFPLRWLIEAYPAPVWLAYIAVGILVARSDLRRPVTQLALVVLGALVAAGAYSIAAAVGHPVLAHDDTTAEVLASGGVAVAVIGALVGLTASAPPRMRRIAERLLYPLAAAGSMPLTVYTLQIVVIWVYITIVDHPGGFLGWQNLPLFVGLAVPTVLAASLWRLRFEQGPLEWVVSRVTTQRPWPEKRRRQTNPPPAL
ncbi:DUF418 domain-containing protein [Herbiconiux daphne]|uniref:DUF418 domain-containing protein n=1 Tax=Herbiconiux daphne TaxID=2970914 RepID=A0ABT2GXF3_9MICO|nr:DUF418 domain-containing protein [Herbiconiux daphne]MCS5732633.1 DUF418 domain-containing protein [Herbiconiux daphne]